MERTTDLRDYNFMAFLNNQGNSTMQQDNEAWNLTRVKGKQYYRLQTTGKNKEVSYSKPAAVVFTGQEDFKFSMCMLLLMEKICPSVFPLTAVFPFAFPKVMSS